MFGLVRHLLPPRCLVCGSGRQIEIGICQGCIARLRRVPEPVCTICGIPLGTAGVCLSCRQDPPPFNRLRGAYCFEGPLVDMIHAFKYGRTTVLKRSLARLMTEALDLAEAPCDLVTGVPMHWTKVMQRGYNQSALLAREVARMIGRPLRLDVLRKEKTTLAQAGLDRKGREMNLRRAFAAHGVQDAAVLVIDDVITTGATAHEVSRTLKAAGAAAVFFAGLGRVL